jgi:nucleoid-associated protein YgaU
MKYTIIGLVILVAFGAAFWLLWDKGKKEDDGFGPGPSSGAESDAPSGEKKTEPTPAAGTRGPGETGSGGTGEKGAAEESPGTAAPAERKGSRLLETDGEEVGEFVKGQEEVIPWLRGEKDSKGAGGTGTTLHTVETTTSLFSLAEDLLGDGARWREIMELNSDVVRDPDRVPRGTVLKIPGATKKTSSLWDSLEKGAKKGSSSGTKLSDLVD